MPPVAALYLRISHDPHGLRAGVERQLTDCQRIAASRFPELPTFIFEDNDRSAWSGARRPAYEEMVRRIGDDVHAIIAWDQDRLLRHPRDLEALIDLCNQHSFTQLVTAQGDLDLTTHDGQLRARILAAVAKKESDDKSRRLTRAFADRASRGQHHGGPAPYGYRRDKDARGGLVVEPLDAASLRWAAEQFLDGAGLVSLARRWPPEARQLVTAFGIRKALLNPTSAGADWDGNVGSWPPILSADVHARLVARLTDSTRRTNGETLARKSWLTGTLTCGRCGERFKTGYNHGRRRYLCKGCHRGIDARSAEAFITEALFEVTRVMTPTPTIDVDAVSAEIVDVEARLRDLTSLWSVGELPRDAFDAGRKRAVGRLAELRSMLGGVSVPMSLGELEVKWPGLDPTQRAKVARDAFIEIVVGEAKVGAAFDPARLTPRWSH